MFGIRSFLLLTVDRVPRSEGLHSIHEVLVMTARVKLDQNHTLACKEVAMLALAALSLSLLLTDEMQRVQLSVMGDMAE